MNAVLGTIATYEPAAPDRKVGETGLRSWPAIASSLDAATAAHRTWKAIPSERVAALDRWADALRGRASELAELIAREVGKPIAEAEAEVARSIAIVRYYAQAVYDPVGVELPPGAPSTSRLTVERRPVGTVLAICPWNFPLAIPIWKAVPALAYGNRVVVRPSSRAIAVSRLLAETADGAAMPPGLLTIWHGPPYAIAEAIRDERIDAVTFTGSETNGRQTLQLAVGHGKRVQAEMGGQNAALVLDDADLDHAADCVAAAAMAFAGQKCTATRRVIVDRRIAERFTTALVGRIERLLPGEPLDPSTTVGPMISESARDVALRMLSTIPSRQILAGNASVAPGWAMAPTVVALDNPGHLVAQEELFAPAISVFVADDDAHAIRLANATRFGLVGAVFGRDVERARTIASGMDVGMVRINAMTTGVDIHAPFGGEGASSYGGRELGRAVRDFMTRTRTVAVGAPPAQTTNRRPMGRTDA